MLLSSLVVILQFLVVAAAFAVIDAVWLKLLNPFYRGHIGDLLAQRPNLGYAVAFYVIYIAGIVFFVAPGARRRQLAERRRLRCPPRDPTSGASAFPQRQDLLRAAEGPCHVVQHG
ncbi:DUF2177 family protein [Arthrobacter sp. NPDC093139]|uniref:DUF2177 family protein n=1 Tax=Arthrobacter sp. NPDC093139 TaxID=3363945 RepID=UPI00380ACFD7